MLAILRVISIFIMIMGVHSSRQMGGRGEKEVGLDLKGKKLQGN